MMDKLEKLKERWFDELETVALGVVTWVDHSKFRCNVKLKNRIQGYEVELFNVPIACLKSSVGLVYVPLKENDVVIVLFSKYELEEQLKNRDVVDVNELVKFDINNAIALSGIFTTVEEIPDITPDRINIIGDVFINGDLDFKTIRGTPAGNGSWHFPGT